MDKLVTIVIPSYNHEQYIHETIKSILSQSYKRIELIVIDDGSTDNSLSVIGKYKDECERRFERFEIKANSNKGLCNSLNEALRWASGDYFSCVASDDKLDEKKIEKQVGILDSNDCVAVFGAAELINSSSQKVGLQKSPYREYLFKDIFLHKAKLYAVTQLIRTQAVIAAGGYPEGILIEDWYMWLKLTSEGGSIMSVSDVFAQYRTHDTNLSKNLEKMHRERLKVVEKFKEKKLYSLAVANCYIATANEALSYSNSISFNFFLSMLKVNPKSFFQVLTFKYLAKFILSFVKN